MIAPLPQNGGAQDQVVLQIVEQEDADGLFDALAADRGELSHNRTRP